MPSLQMNNYILRRMIRTFFAASILSSVILQVNEMVDGIIVGNFISSDAISVIGLVMPFTNILLFFSAIAYNGASYVAAKAFGARDHAKMMRLFIICLFLALVVSVSLACLTSLFMQDIIRLLTKDRQLQQLLEGYLPIMLWVCVAISVQFSATNFLKMLGRPKVVAMVFLLQLILNITLDLILVRSMGIRGAAIATLVSILCSGAIFLPIIFADKDMRYVQANTRDYIRDTKEAVSTGVAASLTLLLNSLQSLLVIEIIQTAQGSNGLFVISAYNQIMMVAWLVLAGSTDILYQIGGHQYGAGDMNGYRRLFSEICRIVFWGLTAIIVAVICYPQILGKLFGTDDALTEWSCQPIRIIVFQLMGLGLGYTLIVNYNVLGRRKMVIALNFMMPVLAVSTTYLCYLCNKEYVWIGYPLGFWLFLLLCLVISRITSLCDKSLHAISLIPNKNPFPSLDLSLRFTDNDTKMLKNSIETFIEGNIWKEQLYGVINIVSSKGDKGYWDFQLKKDGEHFSVLIKCVPGIQQEELPANLNCDISKFNGVTYIEFEL